MSSCKYEQPTFVMAVQQYAQFGTEPVCMFSTSSIARHRWRLIALNHSLNLMLTLENTPCICYCFWVTVVCCAAHEQAAQHLCCCDSSSWAGLQKLLSALTYGLVLNVTHVFAVDKHSFQFSFVFIVVEVHKRRVSRCVVLYKLSACVFGYRQRFHTFIRAPLSFQHPASLASSTSEAAVSDSDTS